MKLKIDFVGDVMPDNKELNQREVFSYIDHQMRKTDSQAVRGISQRTKPNFLFALFVDFIAVAIALGGFYFVYHIFQERAYNLVGAEGSIHGLEDVLYQELQKRATADLAQKEQELASIQAKLANVSASMDQFKAEQQAEMQRQLAAKQAELQGQLAANLANATGTERARLQQEYEQQLAQQQEAIRQRLEGETQQKIQALQQQQQALRAQQQQSASQASTLQTQLSNAQTEMQRQLEAERSRNQAALHEVQLELAQKEKSEGYKFQISSLFQGAINDFNKTRYASARQKLQGVLDLYANKPSDVYISPQDEAVDRFFVNAISDYLTLKESGADNPQVVQQTTSAMQAMAAFTSDWNRGAYNGRTSDANQRINEIKTALPDVFKFYQAYDNFRVVMDDGAAANLLAAANAQYNNGNYKQAIDAYVAILKDYPDVSSRPTILNNLSASILAMSSAAAQGMSADQANAAAEPVYNAARNSYSSQLYTQALASFQSVILKYPNSQYVQGSLDYIKRIYQSQIDAAKDEAQRAADLAAQNASGVNLAALRTNQTAQSKTIYDQAKSAQGSSDYETALTKFTQIIRDFPLSDYASDSIQRMRTIMDLQVKAAASTAAANATQGLVDLNALKTNQTAKAKPLYDQGVSAQNSASYDTALTRYMQIIREFPLSDYVSDSVTRMKAIMDLQVKAAAAAAAQQNQANAGRVDLTALKAEQTTKSKALYDQARASQASGDMESALSSYSTLVQTYPLSSYVADSITQMRSVMDLRTQNAVNQANAGRVDLTALRAEHTQKSKPLFDQAKAAQTSGDYDGAFSKFSDLTTRYPLSDYVTESVQRMRTIMDLRLQNANQQVQSSASRVDLTAMINDQTSGSQSLYDEAKRAQANRSYDTATSKFTSLIKQYPLSQYVGDSLVRLVNMMNQQVQEANTRAVAATNGLVSMSKIAAQQTESSKSLFDAAQNAMTSQNYDTALSKFIELIRKYPLSQYAQSSLNSINTIVTLRVQAAVRQATAVTNRQSIEQLINQQTQVGVDLNVLSGQQTANSKALYYQAKNYQTNQNYDTALTLYYELITKFPLSDYVKYSLDRIQEIIQLKEKDIMAKAEARYSRQVEQNRTAPQTAIYLEKITGRVTGTLGSDILIDVASGESLKIGDKLLIYRRVDAVTIVKIGSATVSEVSSIMSKAAVQSGSQPVRSGDLIFRE